MLFSICNDYNQNHHKTFFIFLEIIIACNILKENKEP